MAGRRQSPRGPGRSHPNLTPSSLAASAVFHPPTSSSPHPHPPFPSHRLQWLEEALLIHLQVVSREGQRSGSRREAAQGGRAAPEEQEANEENEEQDGGQSHGPCLPLILLSLLKVVCSIVCYFALWVGKVCQDPTLAELLLTLQRQEGAQSLQELKRPWSLSSQRILSQLPTGPWRAGSVLVGDALEQRAHPPRWWEAVSAPERVEAGYNVVAPQGQLSDSFMGLWHCIMRDGG